MRDELARDMVLQGMFLLQGAENHINRYPHFESVLERTAGYIGLASDLIRYAEIVATFLWKHTDQDTNYPGVFEYEVTEPLGAWLVANWSDDHVIGFEAELEHRFDAFMNQCHRVDGSYR